MHIVNSLAKLLFRMKLLKEFMNRMDTDGLSSLNYTVIKAEYNQLYNNITVLIDIPDKKVDETNKNHSTTPTNKQHLNTHGNQGFSNKILLVSNLKQPKPFMFFRSSFNNYFFYKVMIGRTVQMAQV